MPATRHQHHFEDLSPDDFERLVYWLAKRSGEYDEVQWYGGVRDKGRDVVAYRHTPTTREKRYIQAKRYRSISFATLRDELDKVADHAEKEPGFAPDVLVFAVACNIPPQVKDQATVHARELGLPEPYYWGRLELDERLKAQPETETEFFGADGRPPVLISSEAIAEHRAALRDTLEREAHERWGGMSIYIQEEGVTLPIEASPYQTGQLGPRQNLLEMFHDADRLLVLGEPGSGKTVSLERLAWELCSGPESVLPVLVRLFHYAGAPLEEWVRSRLQATGHLRLDDDRALISFLKRGDTQFFFLFDGLNEVAPPYRDRLVENLVRWLADYPHHPVVLTTRPQDELWRRLRREIGQAVMIQPINEEQVRDYLVAHLDERGQVLYQQLDQRLQTMARMPLILWLIKEAGVAGESIPGNRGELYARFVSRMLRRDTDRRMDTEIPVRVKREALADLAYYLGLAQRLTCTRDEAEEVIAERFGEKQAAAVLGACFRHGLLAGEEMVWFAPHQTVQEHFAALALRRLAKQEWQQGRWEQLHNSVRRSFTGQPMNLSGLAADDWWAEAFVQLAGLTDDADRLVRDVTRANPWLAWWCIEEGRVVDEATRARVEKRSIRMLRSRWVRNRSRAVQTLAQVRSERVIEPLFLAASDPDTEVAGLAVRALVELEDAVWPTVLAAFYEDKTKWLSVLNYLAAQPDDSLWAKIHWEKILATPVVLPRSGRVFMGRDRKREVQPGDHQLEVLCRFTHPLMQQLILEAPGTFFRSVLVANLAEEAAERIGADGLLTRVGSYYRDIGKTFRPYFFTENQLNMSNPHDRLDPRTSNRIILSHVPDGLEFARKNRLPTAIRTSISEHHGTGINVAFYREAVKAAGEDGGTVRKDEFAYPGPKPQSRESAIIMLADSCETQVRNAEPASLEEIERIVADTVKARLDERQLEESGLNLRDLQELQAAFLSVLEKTFLQRRETRIVYSGRPALDGRERAQSPEPPSSSGQ